MYMYIYVYICIYIYILYSPSSLAIIFVHNCELTLGTLYATSVHRGVSGPLFERWGAGVETQKTVRGEIGGWGRVPFFTSVCDECAAALYSHYHL